MPGERNETLTNITGAGPTVGELFGSALTRGAPIAIEYGDSP